MRRLGLFAGTFDPVTLGHVDIMQRALQLFDKLLIAVAAGHHKRTLFSSDEREEMIRLCISDKDRKRIEVRQFDGLLVHLAREVGATAVVRGMRFVSDFEYELQMAQMNRKLYPAMETIFMTPSEQFSSLNSTLVKEIALNGGAVKGLVAAPVARQLKKKYMARVREKDSK